MGHSGFLSLNDRNILDHAGKISHELAVDKAEQEYEKFHKHRITLEDNVAELNHKIGFLGANKSGSK